MKFILICATGRSGSTTLQRIINTIKEANIYGENYGAVNNLLECYSNIKKIPPQPPKAFNEGVTKDSPVFYNCYDFENVKNHIKNTILSLLTNNNSKKITGFRLTVGGKGGDSWSPTEGTVEFSSGRPRAAHGLILGFKEIRYANCIHLIDEFIELFPNTRVICHIDDDLDRQCKSGWWGCGCSEEEAKEYLKDYNNQFINYSNRRHKCYLSYMKNLFKIDEMKKMFRFLDEELNVNKYNYIINNKL